ncbi:MULTISPECIES: DEAD/DEAH box helicase [Pseudomonas]|jgi:SNF2 family DNA or RNA helicase|uniref:DEAD/DEAH box helicase n=1 Tax=Pseudomonas azotoformans TaxID=47878 RepID=A0A4Q0HCP8_PSEAZ|nr:MULTISPECIES: DEAD/DEAH box helicase [Pseudomonas]OKP66342.1 DEAD/DEAH box helicase [Pseudomonas fluorescens]EPL06794.1 DEAD/DEAH box helicase [Pseudomonas sp. CF150]KTC29116.1 DEAD/DEAH box helicase [Pseudomonas sp. ICMP 19500]OEC53691.1 DEAD/DEAH box helicase [Pseudomonas sp. AP42]RXE46413.1 DEAD/DEAH box helicase [Pseudomonas azotoformans]|eukprot:gene6885-8002_t
MNDLSHTPLSPLSIGLTEFIDEFGDELLDSLNRSNPPVYAGHINPARQRVMDELKRQPFSAQAEVVQAVAALLLDRNEQAAVINAEMGTGKTMMAIAVAAVMHKAGYRRTLIVSPPHLVYKWRREILETIPDARVWVLNGPDSLVKLLKLRDQLKEPYDGRQEFFILGRVRMRMGFHWRSVCWPRRAGGNHHLAGCPDCGRLLEDQEGNRLTVEEFHQEERRRSCPHCQGPLWTLMRPGKAESGTRRATILKSMCRIPTIGPVRADRLLNDFGEDFLASMLIDNVSEFINLMDAQGNFIFSDRQAKRMERAMANIEFGFGEGGYQPTEFIKRQLPDGYFDLLVVDEGHEYKNSGSAQGQAMGVLAAKARKCVLLTGTLMGGYADDLFYLLFRILTRRMIEDGYRPNARGSMAPAAMSFMRDHGVLKDIYTERDNESHKTAKGKKLSVRTVKAPGFGPKGIHRFVLPFTVFLKLKDIGGNVLPAYQEEFIDIAMSAEQASAYQQLAGKLTQELRQALARRDTTLLGVVLNVLLAWPDCCFRPEIVKHPRSKDTLAFVPSIFADGQRMPKEQALLDLCLTEKAKDRKVLVYTVYSGTRDTTSRLKRLLEQAGLKVAVLRASVDTARREDWILDQVDRGIDVLITNPELVKTGLDLLDFPTIAFLQTGYNVYTLQQAARRSWRIGQKQAVRVIFFGYANSSQITCLQLMAKKIAVAQSTSGDVPDSGLDSLNQDGDSVEMALARQLIAA